MSTDGASCPSPVTQQVPTFHPFSPPLGPCSLLRPPFSLFWTFCALHAYWRISHLQTPPWSFMPLLLSHHPIPPPPLLGKLVQRVVYAHLHLLHHLLNRVSPIRLHLHPIDTFLVRASPGSPSCIPTQWPESGLLFLCLEQHLALETRSSLGLQDTKSFHFSSYFEGCCFCLLFPNPYMLASPSLSSATFLFRTHSWEPKFSIFCSQAWFTLLKLWRNPERFCLCELQWGIFIYWL